MSMLGTLGKVAVGIMVARTVGKAVGGSGGGLGDMLGNMLGGKSGSASAGTTGGGLGDMLGGLLGGKGATASSGNLGDLMGSLMGGSQSAPGTGSANATQGGLADLLRSAMQGEEVKAEPTEEEQAKLILKAMIQAAKSDGVLDAEEQANILKHAGDATPDELAYVKEILDAPVNVEALVAEVPEGMEQQVYLMSLLTINLDTQQEAQYLDQLAKGLGISPETANMIHEKAGAQKLYS